MDVREPVAKMRGQAEQNRKREAELKADAQHVIAVAKSEYERIAAESQARFNEISAQADAQRDEAIYWDGLADREEKQAAITVSPTDTLTDGLDTRGEVAQP